MSVAGEGKYQYFEMSQSLGNEIKVLISVKYPDIDFLMISSH